MMVYPLVAGAMITHNILSAAYWISRYPWLLILTFNVVVMCVK